MRHLAFQNSKKIASTLFSWWAMNFWKLMVEFLRAAILNLFFSKIVWLLPNLKTVSENSSDFGLWTKISWSYNVPSHCNSLWKMGPKTEKVQKSELSQAWICAAKFDHAFSKIHSLATERHTSNFITVLKSQTSEASYWLLRMLKSHIVWPHRSLKDV